MFCFCLTASVRFVRNVFCDGYDRVREGGERAEKVDGQAEGLAVF